MTKWVKLSDVAKIDISSVNKKSKVNEKNVYLCNFVDVYRNWAVNKDMLSNFMIATASDKNIKRFSLKRGQVAITKDSETRDDIGMSTYIADNLEDTVLGYHCALITPNEDYLIGSYLNAYLSSPLGRKYFSNQASGSGQRYTLVSNAIGDIKIPLIELNLQKKIGYFFSRIDRKIQNNNAISKELESMAKTIYDYWFLQFEFPDKDGKPYKSNGGKMIWNDQLKQEIPEGWEVGTIEDLGEIISGGTPSTKKKDYYSKKGIAWLTPNDLSNSHNKYITHGERDITKEGLENSSARLMPKGTVLLTSRAPIGYLGIAINKVTTNQGFKSIVPKKTFGSEYIYYTLKNLIPYLKSVGTGSTFTEISKTVLKDVKIPIPAESVVSYFENIVSSLGTKHRINETENQQLQSLRDFLLPMLMNGQVIIED